MGRNSRKSTVNLIMKDHSMRKLVAEKMGKLVNKELQVTCYNKTKSKFKDKSLEALTSFSWTEVLSDLKRTAPLLTAMFHHFIGTYSSQSQVKRKEVSVVIAAGIFLQAFSERANLIQRLFSLLLYSNHCPKQVTSYISYFICNHYVIF